MNTKYLLPCPNGHAIEIDRSQAGLTVHCACGAEVLAPTFRGLAELQRLSESGDAPGKMSGGRQVEWNWGVALVLVGAFVIATATAAGAYFKYTYPPHPSSLIVIDEVQNRDLIDKLPHVELLQEWERLRGGITMFHDEQLERMVQTYDKMALEWDDWFDFVYVAAGVGAVLVIIGLVGSRRKR